MSLWSHPSIASRSSRRAPAAANGLLVLAALSFVGGTQVGCTTPEVAELGWSVYFGCADVAEQAEQVRVSIAPGECTGTATDVYEATVLRAGGGDLEPPSKLPPGTYAFRATAFDAAGASIAVGCRTVDLPGTESVSLELLGAGTCQGGGGSGVVGDGDGGMGDPGVAPTGPRIELVSAELLPDGPISVRFLDVKKPGMPTLALYKSGSEAAVATFKIPFKRTEEVVSGMHDFPPQPAGLYEVKLAYDSGVVSSAKLEVIADRDQDKIPDRDDGCADDPMKSEPGTCGCGTSDADTDSDGSVDCKDECPSDALKQVPGFCGCGRLESNFDQDGDGLVDCYDDCWADPTKQRPLVCGCGVPETDTDADASPDCVDQCAMDPAKTTPGACGCGISEADKDSDLTPDCKDLCSADPAKVAPGTCGCGAKEPFDNPDYRDKNGDRCSAWKGYDCKTAVEKYRFSQAQEDALLANCSLTCSTCPK